MYVSTWPGFAGFQGDSVQAGRWGYLAEERSESETSSFEKAMRNPVNQSLRTCRGSSVSVKRLDVGS